MIELRRVTYRYPDTEEAVIDGVDLRVERGEVLGVVGASGAGKTTLAKIMSGFIPHVDGGELEGDVVVDDVELSSVKLVEAVRAVGLVIQNPFNQISGAKYTVREEVAFGLENLGVERAEMAERVARIAELLKIGHLLDRSPYALSGGQQQLVAIASMVVLETPVLVMDEPTSQLDPAGTRMVFDVLSSLRARGVTVVVFEHKIELLREHCDRVAVLAGTKLPLVSAPGLALADPRMPDWGVQQTRYTQAAMLACERGLSETGRPLPVSLREARGYFADGEVA